MKIECTFESLKEKLINDRDFIYIIAACVDREFSKRLDTYYYDKKQVAKEIIKLLENVNVRDWEKIKQIIDSRYSFIKDKSNFSCDKVTLNKIESWF